MNPGAEFDDPGGRRVSLDDFGADKIRQRLSVIERFLTTVFDDRGGIGVRWPLAPPERGATRQRRGARKQSEPAGHVLSMTL
jgi:hypothetical protein